MTILAVVLIIITEIMAYFDEFFMMRLRSYMMFSLNSLPLLVYRTLAPFIFGVLLCMIAKWLQGQKRAVPIFLATFNSLLLLLQPRKLITFSASIFILTGFYIAFAILKQKENPEVDCDKDGRTAEKK